MIDDEKERRSYLRDEYLLLQNQYEDYDKRSLTIKGWVSTGAIASLALSFKKDEPLAMAIPIFVMIIAMVFWYLEAHWKLFQYALADRIRIIEAHFRGETEILTKDPVPFQIYNSWSRSYAHDEPIYEWESTQGTRRKSKPSRLIAVAKADFVCLPYVVLILLAMIALGLIAFQ